MIKAYLFAPFLIGNIINTSFAMDNLKKEEFNKARIALKWTKIYHKYIRYGDDNQHELYRISQEYLTTFFVKHFGAKIDNQTTNKKDHCPPPSLSSSDNNEINKIIVNFGD